MPDEDDIVMPGGDELEVELDEEGNPKKKGEVGMDEEEDDDEAM